MYENVPTEFNDVRTNLCSLNGIYDTEVMCSKFFKQGDIGRFKALVDSCNVTDKRCLLEEATITTADLTDDKNSLSDDSSIDSDEDTGTDHYFDDWEERIQATLESDWYMASAAHTSLRKNISDDQLSKVWKIDRNSAQRTLDVTSQHCKRKVNPDFQEIIPQEIECCGTNS